MLKYLIAAAIALCSAAAVAEPQVGSTLGGRGERGFMCDTDAQVHALFDAAAKDETGGALNEEYAHLNALKNDLNEPACLYGGIAGVNVIKVTHLGRVTLKTRTYDAWLVNIVGNHDITGSILIPEVVEATPSEAPKSEGDKQHD